MSQKEYGCQGRNFQHDVRMSVTSQTVAPIFAGGLEDKEIYDKGAAMILAFKNKPSHAMRGFIRRPCGVN